MIAAVGDSITASLKIHVRAAAFSKQLGLVVQSRSLYPNDVVKTSTGFKSVCRLHYQLHCHFLLKKCENLLQKILTFFQQK